MAQDDPRHILTLVAEGTLAEQSWCLPENRDRFEPASEYADKIIGLSSRDTTPALSEQYEPPASKIHLSFAKKPKNLEKGFVFGSHQKKCDILLGARGISREHFRIAFNADGQLILEATSKFETSVGYNNKELPRRNHFTWMLFEDYQNITIKLNAGTKSEFIFGVIWPQNRKSRLTQYEAHRDAYLRERQDATPSISRLGIESRESQCSPIYLFKEKVGCGAYGSVYKVMNVTTGSEYAGKIFHNNKWERELDILENISHEHIVDFIDFSEDPQPLLVMEYLSFGNLACQDHISQEAIIQVLYQGLQALKYLHGQSPPLAHRDIKPENILVKSRIPFAIKLGDFGLAKNTLVNGTICGTYEYTAPEVWDRQYTTLVDIWSLGVVVLECRYRLPKPTLKRRGHQWSLDIMKAADNHQGRGDSLADLISNKMLKRHDQGRCSARQCLEEVYLQGFHQIQVLGTQEASQTALIRNNGASHPLGLNFTSEATEVTPSKCILRDEVHHFHAGAPQLLRGQEARQTENTQVEDEERSRRSKRRHPEITQSPAIDGVGVQPKRSRPFGGVDKQFWRVSDCHHDPQQLETFHIRSHSEVSSTLASGERPRETENASSQNDSQDNVGASPACKIQSRAKAVHASLVKQPLFLKVKAISPTLTVRTPDYRIRINDIDWPSNQPQKRELAKIRRSLKDEFDVVQSSYKGTYVDLWNVVNLCRRYGLTALEKDLHTWDNHGRPVEELEVSKFIEIEEFGTPVVVRRPDLRINVTNIYKLAGYPRRKVTALRRRIGSEAYDFMCGKKHHQGTYVDFDIGVEVCQEYKLYQLGLRLLSVVAELGHTVHQDHTPSQLPELQGPLAPDETTQSMEIPNPRSTSSTRIIDRAPRMGDDYNSPASRTIREAASPILSQFSRVDWTMQSPTGNGLWSKSYVDTVFGDECIR